jgi:hypothetical protein
MIRPDEIEARRKAICAAAEKYRAAIEEHENALRNYRQRRTRDAIDAHPNSPTPQNTCDAARQVEVAATHLNKLRTEFFRAIDSCPVARYSLLDQYTRGSR